MTHKCVVKVVLSKEQKSILCELARRLGIGESEMFRTALNGLCQGFEFSC